ncbi:hypothetical protein D3C76_1173280 [compost metagenome]
MAMAGEVQRDDAQSRQARCQAGEAVGVVEPAMQGDHRLAVLRAVEVRGQFDMGQVEADFFDLGSHALASWRWASQRPNTDLISSAVSCGRSRGNMCPPGSDRHSPRGTRLRKRV